MASANPAMKKTTNPISWGKMNQFADAALLRLYDVAETQGAGHHTDRDQRQHQRHFVADQLGSRPQYPISDHLLLDDEPAIKNASTLIPVTAAI